MQARIEGRGRSRRKTADEGARSWRACARWNVAPEASLSVEATRNASDGDPPENGLMLRGALRW